MKGLHKIAWVLLVIGGLNWGLTFFGFGIGNYLPEGLASLVYLLVGISAIVEIVNHKGCCTACGVKGGEPMNPQM